MYYDNSVLKIPNLTLKRMMENYIRNRKKKKKNYGFILKIFITLRTRIIF